MAPARPALVDAHVHLWDLEMLSYPWLTPPFSGEGVAGDVGAIAQTYSVEDYRTDAEGWTIEGVVHVEAGADPRHALEETRWLQGIADAAPFPIALVAYAPLNDPHLEPQLAAHVESPAVRGVRQILNWHDDPRKTYTPRDLLAGDGDFARGYGLLAKYGLSFDLQIYPSQMRAAAALASAHPDIPVILNHAGMPLDRGPTGLDLWRDGMRTLAALPHVSTKISGFGIVDHAWTPETIRPLVLDAIDIFGVERTLIASDVPTDKLYAPFNGIMGAYDAITQDFSKDERRALFSDNARRIYRLD